MADQFIDELMVPVLCNLAACALRIGVMYRVITQSTRESLLLYQAWSKAVQFSKEALKQRPTSVKALMKCGAAHFADGDYKLAWHGARIELHHSTLTCKCNRACFTQALKHAENQANINAPKATEQIREIQVNLQRTADKLRELRVAQKREEIALQKLFGNSTNALYSVSNFCVECRTQAFKWLQTAGSRFPEGSASSSS